MSDVDEALEGEVNVVSKQLVDDRFVHRHLVLIVKLHEFLGVETARAIKVEFIEEGFNLLPLADLLLVKQVASSDVFHALEVLLGVGLEQQVFDFR